VVVGAAFHQVPAQRVVVGAAHGDVEMHDWLAILPPANVPAQVQHLHLLFHRPVAIDVGSDVKHRPVAIDVGSDVKIAQRDLPESADGVQFGETDLVLIGETFEALNDLVARL